MLFFFFFVPGEAQTRPSTHRPSPVLDDVVNEELDEGLVRISPVLDNVADYDKDKDLPWISPDTPALDVNQKIIFLLKAFIRYKM